MHICINQLLNTERRRKMANRVYAHSFENGRNICKADTFIRIPNKEKIEEIKNELLKYGEIAIIENCVEPITEIHLIVKIPYKVEILSNGK